MREFEKKGHASRSSRVVILAMFVVLSSVIYVLETFIPVPIPLPGFKWGFSNSIVIMVMIIFGSLEAFSVTVLKSVLGALMAGRLFSPVFFISFFGGIAGVLTMILFFRKFKSGLIITSIYGSVANNLIQLFIAYVFFVKSEYVFVYLPYVAFIGIIASIINVFIAVGGIKWMKNLDLR